MEIVSLARRQLSAHEHEVSVCDHARLAVPEVRFARKLFDFGLAQRNDSPWGIGCRHAVSVLTRGRWRQELLAVIRNFCQEQSADGHGVLREGGDADFRTGREGLHGEDSEMALDGLRQFEFGLRRSVLGEERDELFLSGTDQVPDGFRRMVEEYYRALSREDGR